jgi:hypothetical protein
MRKFHKLLHGTGSLYDQIVPTTEQEKTLRDAKNKVRDHLRIGIHAASVAKLKMAHAVYPRFRTQGSWAYASCIQQAHVPPQEMDWDYGVYLPVEALDDAGTPRVVAGDYFDAVEALLKDLCDEEGWKLGKEKDHCIRVHVTAWAHVDVALYAAPADQFANVSDRNVESVEKAYTFDAALNARLLSEASEISVEQNWDEFDDMMVATRKGTWERSDAEAIANWFRDQREIHGDQLQRIWRYIKAWRDFVWKEGGPSSVMLMLIASHHFEKVFGRDDLALTQVVKALPGAITNDVYEEGIDPEHNFNRMTGEERAEARRHAEQLFLVLHEARTNVVQPKSAVIDALRSQWGARMPGREADVENDSPADQLRETPARKVPPPIVDSSFAG